MASMQRQKLRDRMDAVQDTLVGAQCLPKDVTKYLKDLEKAASLNGKAAPVQNDSKAFLRANPGGI